MVSCPGAWTCSEAGPRQGQGLRGCGLSLPNGDCAWLFRETSNLRTLSPISIASGRQKLRFHSKTGSDRGFRTPEEPSPCPVGRVVSHFHSSLRATRRLIPEAPGPGRLLGSPGRHAPSPQGTLRELFRVVLVPNTVATLTTVKYYTWACSGDPSLRSHPWGAEMPIWTNGVDLENEWTSEELWTVLRADVKEWLGALRQLPWAPCRRRACACPGWRDRHPACRQVASVVSDPYEL